VLTSSTSNSGLILTLLYSPQKPFKKFYKKFVFLLTQYYFLSWPEFLAAKHIWGIHDGVVFLRGEELFSALGRRPVVFCMDRNI